MEPIVPFEPVAADEIPAGPQWVAQIKWDGVRMLVYFDGATTKLVNRRLHERTMQYPELADARRYCRAKSAILDGEIVAFDAAKPSFHEVMRRDGVRNPHAVPAAAREIPITYMVFDILYHDGEWVTGRSLEERQRLLSRAVEPGDAVRLVGNETDGAKLFEVMRKHGMEGIVVKDLASTYAIGGKDGRWRKIKVRRDLTAVVGGVTYSGSVGSVSGGVTYSGSVGSVSGDVTYSVSGGSVSGGVTYSGSVGSVSGGVTYSGSGGSVSGGVTYSGSGGSGSGGVTGGGTGVSGSGSGGVTYSGSGGSVSGGGRGGRVNALLLGLYDAQGRLHYIGHAGSGRLTGRDWAEITAAAELLRTPDCPFAARPPRSAGAVWLRPLLTAKVRYLEWTEGRTLRQPVIEAVGAGPPEDCSFERLDDAPV